MKHLVLQFHLLILCLSLHAQSHADCSLSLEICNKQPLILPLIYGAGNEQLELDSATCSLGFTNIETNAAWVRWQVAQSGTLWFIIYPLNPVDDIDFFVYRLPTGTCAQKTNVRCMSAGDLSPTSPCMGPTGLLPGETDVSSPFGCASGNNNFLASLNVLAGEQYVLAINNFSSSLDTVRVEFCGTALLGCETEMCTVLDANAPLSLPDLSVGLITPNPCLAKENARVQINAEHAQTILIVISDSQGNELTKYNQLLSLGTNSIALQTLDYQAGVYFVTIMSENAKITKRMVITNAP